MAIQNVRPGRLCDYRLLHPVAQGRMGSVRLAADPQGRLVAIKALPPGALRAPKARHRLARGLRELRRARCPYIADLIDADLAGDVPYLVTRLPAGRRLDEVVAEHGPLAGRALQRLAYGLAQALAVLHAAGVARFDLRPGNVMMAGGDPVLIDFGPARGAQAIPVAQLGASVPEPGYVPPETIDGEEGGPSSDVHSWGAVVAFAARGESPYGIGPYETVFCRILRGDPDLTGVDPALRPLVAAALQRQPDRRPAAAWLASEVVRLDLTTGRLSRPPRARRVQRPHRTLGLLVLLLAVEGSLALPVAGPLAAAAMITALRAGDHAATRMGARRGARGPRAWDPMLLTASMPWLLARSVIGTLLLAPLLLALGLVVVVAGTMAIRHWYVPSLGAAVAVAYTVLSCLGPRSRSPRRQLNRIFNVVAPTRLAGVATALTLGAFGAIMIPLALHAHTLWPLPELGTFARHLPGISEVYGSIP